MYVPREWLEKVRMLLDIKYISSTVRLNQGYWYFITTYKLFRSLGFNKKKESLQNWLKWRGEGVFQFLVESSKCFVGQS